MGDRFRQVLRQNYQGIRKHLPLAYQQEVASKICTAICALDSYRYAKHIALYFAIRGEVNLHYLWQSAPLQGKYCYFPAIKDNFLVFLPATPATPFRPNQHGILEPDVAHSFARAPEEIDLIFMPLVAFDPSGTRLGTGAGYYDRTLAHYNHPLLIGVAYEFQRVGYIQRQPWDIPLTCIITERKIYRSFIPHIE